MKYNYIGCLEQTNSSQLDGKATAASDGFTGGRSPGGRPVECALRAAAVPDCFAPRRHID